MNLNDGLASCLLSCCDSGRAKMAANNRLVSSTRLLEASTL